MIEKRKRPDKLRAKRNSLRKGSAAMKARNRSISDSEQSGGSQAPVREFSLTLPMTVSGLNARGQEFRENSVLATISSEQASFLLRTRVERKTVLKLVILCPPSWLTGSPWLWSSRAGSESVNRFWVSPNSSG